jgi:hypothetical protein
MALRKRLIVLTSVVGFGWLTGCGGATSSMMSPTSTTTTSPSNTVDVSRFVGLWQNVNPDTLDIPQLQIRVDGATIYVHGYGACGPTGKDFCDWGEASALAALATTGGFNVFWSFAGGMLTELMTLSLSTDGALHTSTFTHFNDNSGRADNTVVDVFNKAS